MGGKWVGVERSGLGGPSVRDGAGWVLATYIARWASHPSEGYWRDCFKGVSEVDEQSGDLVQVVRQTCRYSFPAYPHHCCSG